MKSSLKGRTLLQRPRSRHENGLPFSCVPNCKIGVPFTFMIPFGTECPENMEDIEQVKVSTKDYCLDIPKNRKVCTSFDTGFFCSESNQNLLGHPVPSPDSPEYLLFYYFRQLSVGIVE